jgi:hypothetical protein
MMASSVSTLATLTNGLRAALLLAQGDPAGLRLLDAGQQPADQGAATARRSFWAMALCLPLFAALRLLDWTQGGMPRRLGHAVALEAGSFVIGWVGFLLLSRPLAAWFGRAGRWPRYVAVWNWCNVAQYALLAASELPALLGAPLWAQQMAALVAVFWAIWLEWFATRLALELGLWTAALLTALDIGLGAGLSALTTFLSPG